MLLRGEWIDNRDAAPREAILHIFRQQYPAAGFGVNRNQIALNAPIKTIGQHKVAILLHPEIETSVSVIVARNKDEAERIARGEDVTQLREEPTESPSGVWPVSNT